MTFPFAVATVFSAFLLCRALQSSAFLVQTSPMNTVLRPTSPATTMVEIGCLFASSRSRIEGNQREPTEQELQIMDEMIDKLSVAKPFELPNAVRRAFRVISSPRFFLRIADRTDKAKDEMERKKLETLASNLVATLEAVVETTEEKLDERAKEVEQVLKAAAEPETGEFLVPLLPEQVKAMRKVVENLEPSSLDEGFLSTVDAFMMKSHQDGMDGMVEILQKCLQQYSGVSILRARKLVAKETSNDNKAAQLFDKLLEMDAGSWDVEIKNSIQNDNDLTPQSLIGEIQKTMETVVLGLENGSMAQRVQAEYLRELVSRVEALETATR
ncbi:hypothetical protein IV203_030261 [Nitzschia inconspicua]|uniref:Uncharacterized protein n=1 Tax=Nitzschia inconspicua TaxID=303405 RepID=A0A9K3LTF3_9STRA|nr:hypothetical protein IV203_030261 [Nitzschia inconspicua]